VILDNCEHVIAEVASLAQALMPKCREFRSWRPAANRLAIAGESIFRVPSLSSPARRALTGRLRESMQRAAVCRAAAALGEDFNLTDDNAAPSPHLPMDRWHSARIELAAPRLRVMSEQQLVDGLDARFSLLTGGNRVAVHGTRTACLIDWSYSCLR